MSAGVPSQPRIYPPSTLKALQAARGETWPHTGRKWLIVIAAAVALLLFILIGPLFLG